MIIELGPSDLNNPERMLDLNELMDKLQMVYIQEIQAIAQKFDIPDSYASCIWYLRTRSRWTQELEDKLISMSKNSEPCPNMCEWP